MPIFKQNHHKNEPACVSTNSEQKVNIMCPPRLKSYLLIICRQTKHSRSFPPLSVTVISTVFKQTKRGPCQLTEWRERGPCQLTAYRERWPCRLMTFAIPWVRPSSEAEDLMTSQTRPRCISEQVSQPCRLWTSRVSFKRAT